jgi:hypothetical protein
MCKCVLYFCHRVATQLQLTDISISFGPKGGQVAGEWRRQPKEELHDMYFSPNTSLMRNEE